MALMDAQAEALLAALRRISQPRSAEHLGTMARIATGRARTVLDRLARQGHIVREVRPVYDGPGGGARSRAFYSLPLAPDPVA